MADHAGVGGLPPSSSSDGAHPGAAAKVSYDVACWYVGAGAHCSTLARVLGGVHPIPTPLAPFRGDLVLHVNIHTRLTSFALFVDPLVLCRYVIEALRAIPIGLYRKQVREKRMPPQTATWFRAFARASARFAPKREEGWPQQTAA